MNYKNRLNQHEIENLSAYLDHELSEAEEARMRARLAEDASLRDALEDLRLTRYTLRNAPRVKRQRSFTLTPEMVRQQRFAWRALNFSRIVAVTASVLFAVIFGGQMLLGSRAGSVAFAPQENAAMDVVEMEEPMALEAPAEEAEPLDDSAMPGMAAESSVDETEMDAAAEEEVPEEAPVEEEAAEEPFGIGGGPTQTPDGSPAPAAEADAPETPEPGGGGGEPPTAPAEPEPEPTTTGEFRTMPTEKRTPDESMEGESVVAGDELLEPEQLPEVQPEEQPEREGISLIGWVQIGLVVLALFGSGAWIYFRRMVR